MSNKEFIPKEHKETRTLFRTVGPLILGAGIICALIAGVDFFAGDPFDGPNYFYLFFIGFPLIAIGSSLCKLGYGAQLAQYQSRELAPVAKDTINYLAKETTEGVETIARAVQKGKSTVVEAKVCANCQQFNKIDAKFCNECGSGL